MKELKIYRTINIYKEDKKTIAYSALNLSKAFASLNMYDSYLKSDDSYYFRDKDSFVTLTLERDLDLEAVVSEIVLDIEIRNEEHPISIVECPECKTKTKEELLLHTINNKLYIDEYTCSFCLNEFNAISSESILNIKQIANRQNKQ